ncbi:WD40 repeat protein [Dokdonella fugitiva]|uniref:WD40 repeat protein n=2 Tax=Dokdonella fugitiva TaxID=328517 RepID=A0A4V2S2K7_9GAMM|nr:WD40 repeat protein [Dokdonella fugitiva]
MAPMHRRHRAPSIATAVISSAFVACGVAAGERVEPWTPAGISSSRFESHAAFDPRTGDVWFVRSSPKFEGWRILVSRCGANGWGDPQPPPFPGDGVEADPWFTSDGRTLYFISSRTRDGTPRKDLDIWRVDRAAGGQWGTPQRLPEPVNSSAQEWFPRLASDGWLYFGSGRPGGHGKTDIWRAREEGGRWTVENAGPAFNGPGDEYEPLPSTDGTWMLLEGNGAYYRVRRDGNGWRPREKLPAEINRNGSEIGATFSPSGRTVLFARDTKGPLSGEFFLWHVGAHEAWPPACPAPK